MCEAMAAAAEREFEVYEQRIAELREHLSHSCSLTEFDRVSADLARALPVVEAAEALVEGWGERPRVERDDRWCSPQLDQRLDALARAVKGERA